MAASSEKRAFCMFWGMEAFQQAPCSIKVKSVSELLENVNALLSHGNRILVSSPRKLSTLHLAIRIPSAFGCRVFNGTLRRQDVPKEGDQNGAHLDITQRAKGGVSTSRRTS